MIKTHFPLMTDSQVRGLIRHFRRHGNRDVLNRVVEANIGLAKKIANQYKVSGVDIDDLFSEAIEGLIRGCELYDPDRGVKLSTYASWWIRAKLLKYIMRHNTVHFATTGWAREIYHRFVMAAKHNEEVDIEKLAKDNKVSVEDVLRVKARIGSHDASMDKLRYEKNSLHDTMASDDPSPEDEAISSYERGTARERVRAALTHLDERERMVVERRMMSDEPVTLQELGTELGVTRERVRQIEQKAKRRLKDILAA